MKRYIYIPGFNTWEDPLRKLALRRWESETSKVTFVAMRWTDRSETYQQKYARLESIVRQFTNDDEITLVGESAGGAMALALFARNRNLISNVVTVCGYNHGSTYIGGWYRQRSPAFYQAVQSSERAIDTLSLEERQRITTVYATTDHTVSLDRTQISGAHEVVHSRGGHLYHIARVLINKLKDAI